MTAMFTDRQLGRYYLDSARRYHATPVFDQFVIDIMAGKVNGVPDIGMLAVNGALHRMDVTYYERLWDAPNWVQGEVVSPAVDAPQDAEPAPGGTDTPADPGQVVREPLVLSLELPEDEALKRALKQTVMTPFASLISNVGKSVICTGCDRTLELCTEKGDCYGPLLEAEGKVEDA